MSKRTFIVFGMLVVALAVAIPWLVFNSKGDAKTGAQDVAGQLKTRPVTVPDQLRQLPHALQRPAPTATTGRTSTNCSPRAGRLTGEAVESAEGRVLNAIENGVDGSTTPGRMPAGILNETQAKEVAAFVANTAGEG